MEASICYSDSWLQSYKQKRSKFLPQEIPPQQTLPPVDTSPSTVRTLWKVIFRPFSHAESDGHLCFIIAQLCVELRAKTIQIP